MVNITNIVKGVLVFILGVFFTILSYYIVPSIIYEMQSFGDATASALLTTVFWGGYILLIILAVFIAPAMIIFQESNQK